MIALLLSAGLLLCLNLPAVSGAGGRQAPAARPAPGLGSFSQPMTLTGAVSGQAFTWQGTITFSTNPSESRRRISGTGDFTLIVPPPPLALSYLSMAPAAVLAGQSATVTVVLNRAPGVAVQIPLKSSDPSVATVADSLTIQPAQTQGTAVVTTQQVLTMRMVAVTATYGGQSKGANLQVNPVSPPPPPPPPPVNQPRLQVSANPLDFGTAYLTSGFTGNIRSLTITNAGQGTLTGQVGALTGDAAYSIIQGAGESFSLLGGQVQMVTLRFKPLVPGAVQASLLLRSNDPAGVQTVLCLGTARVNFSPPAIRRATTLSGLPVPFPLMPDQQVRIEGAGFGADQGEVFANGYSLAPLTWMDTAIVFTVPALLRPQYPGDLMVRRPDGEYYHGMFQRDGSPPVPEPPALLDPTDPTEFPDRSDRSDRSDRAAPAAMTEQELASARNIAEWRLRSRRSDPDWEDMIQEAVIATWRALESCPPAAPALSLSTIAARQAGWIAGDFKRHAPRVPLLSLDALQEQATERGEPELDERADLPRAADFSPALLERLEHATIIRELFALCTPRQRAALNHCYLRGKGASQYARERGVGVTAVQQLLAHGLNNYRLRHGLPLSGGRRHRRGGASGRAEGEC